MNVPAVATGPNPAGHIRGNASAPGAERSDEAHAANAVRKADKVTLSEAPPSLRLTEMIVERILTKTESEASASASESLLQANGKEAYLASVEGATDQSADAVSDRIFNGITSYIFGAFQSSHPDMTAEDLDTFKSQVMVGVEQGLSEAREVLTALSALSPSIDSTIDDTIGQLHEKLNSWFAEMAQSIADGAAESEAAEAEDVAGDEAGPEVAQEA